MFLCISIESKFIKKKLLYSLILKIINNSRMWIACWPCWSGNDRKIEEKTNMGNWAKEVDWQVPNWIEFEEGGGTTGFRMGLERQRNREVLELHSFSLSTLLLAYKWKLLYRILDLRLMFTIKMLTLREKQNDEKYKTRLEIMWFVLSLFLVPC